MASSIRVKVLEPMAGTGRYGTEPVSYPPGSEMEIRDEIGPDGKVIKTALQQARRLVALGQAEPLEGYPIPPGTRAEQEQAATSAVKVAERYLKRVDGELVQVGEKVEPRKLGEKVGPPRVVHV
jgi:hypothetical protein